MSYPDYTDTPDVPITTEVVDTQPHIHNINEVHAEQQSRGDCIADKVTLAMGTWKFIAIQGVVLFVWMVGNVAAFFFHFDPYPFIFLNLLLGIFSTFAAPFILMSQNRQAAKDSLVLDHNYELAKHEDATIRTILDEQLEQSTLHSVVSEHLRQMDEKLDGLETLIRENLHQHPLRQRNMTKKQKDEMIDDIGANVTDSITNAIVKATPVEPIYIPLTPNYAPNPYNLYANPQWVTTTTDSTLSSGSFTLSIPATTTTVNQTYKGFITSGYDVAGTSGGSTVELPEIEGVDPYPEEGD